jgi:hypothetical protein
LIFCAWRASWLRIVAASGVNFLESVAVGAGFFLARIVSPQFPPDRRAQFQVAIEAPHRSLTARSVSSCDQTSTPIAHGANFSFFSRADAIFPFKPDNSTPIAISAFSFKLDLFNLSKYHFHKRIKLGS